MNKNKKVIVALIFAVAMLVTAWLVRDTGNSIYVVIGFILLWAATDQVILKKYKQLDETSDSDQADSI